jgi:glycerol kinase
MPELFLALDAGTTNIRAMAVDGEGRVAGESTAPVSLNYPQPGRVETEPDAFWDTALHTLRECMESAGMAASNAASLGITGQRTSLVIWDRSTGAALSPIVSWQDLRGITRSMSLAEAGYPLIPLSSACKLESVLADIPNGVARFNSGDLAWGNVDTYLAWRLSGGSAYATDPSQACATGYLDLETTDWNAELIAHQQLNPDSFPNVADTFGRLGETDAQILGAAIPIGAIVGDQQCAALAQGCLQPGDSKITYGTSGTCNLNTGAACPQVSGAYPLVLYRIGEETVYCLESMIITAGAMLDWLAYGLQLGESPGELLALAETVPDSAGVFVLPALQGLGSPHADSSRAAAIDGMTRGTTRAHIVRAALEGIAYRTRAMLDDLYGQAGYPFPGVLRVDGGMTRSDTFLQILADTTGATIEAMTPRDATTYGAALLAGVSGGRWALDDLPRLRETASVHEPGWSRDERDSRYEEWRRTFHL